jgi:ATP-dependent Clp protease ATP-binding subunit ClpB
MARSAASRLARAARAAVVATRRRQAPGVSREVLPRSLAPLAGDASAFGATTGRPAWFAAPLGRFPVGAGGAGLQVPPRRLFHSTTPAQYSAAGTSSSSQVGATMYTAARVSVLMRRAADWVPLVSI